MQSLAELCHHRGKLNANRRDSKNGAGKVVNFPGALRNISEASSKKKKNHGVLMCIYTHIYEIISAAQSITQGCHYLVTNQ